MNQKTPLKQQLRNSAEGFPLLGYVIYWSTSNFIVKHDEVVERLKKYGFDVKMAPQTLPKHAITRALKGISKETKNTMHKKVLEEDKISGFTITSHEVQNQSTEDFDVSFNTEARVIFDKKTKTVKVIGASKEATKKIIEKFELYISSYTDEQFRVVARRIIRDSMDSFTIRDGGGVYFIPYDMKEELNNLEQLFTEFLGCSLDIIPVIDTVQARAAMFKAFVGDAQQELREFKADLEKLPDTIKAKSYETRIARFKVLKSKIHKYEAVLSGTAKDLAAELDSLTSDLKKRILE